jgi:hypothetical protein
MDVCNFPLLKVCRCGFEFLSFENQMDHFVLKKKKEISLEKLSGELKKEKKPSPFIIWDPIS